LKRREFLGTLAAAGVTLAAGRAVAGHGVQYEGKPVTRSVEDKPVILEVAINGSTTRAKNKNVPVTPQEIGAEMIRVFDAGATIVHAHSGQPNKDIEAAAKVYIEAFTPVREKHPYAIMYPTTNFDPKIYMEDRTVWPGKIQSGHYRAIAEAGLANMVLLDTAVSPMGAYQENGLPGPMKKYFWYGMWPDDIKIVHDVCTELGTGASISVFEPCWMKNVVAMAHKGTLPRGSKLNIYFADYDFTGCAPPIPEALEMYLHMIEGIDVDWAVGMLGKNIMETPLARMALERGGSFRVGLEDWGSGPSNVEQMERAKELINKFGRPILSGPEAIEYLDIPFPATRPKA
jgi:3-keto-5-aminohexanoate cleavage enzyme